MTRDAQPVPQALMLVLTLIGLPMGVGYFVFVLPVLAAYPWWAPWCPWSWPWGAVPWR